MAKIDRLIGILVDKQIPLAALQPDSPIMLDMGGGDTRSLNDKEISARRVELLLSEILPKQVKEELRFSGRAEFRYESPHGAVGVTALRRGGKLSVYLSTAGVKSTSESSVVAESEAEEVFDLYDVSESGADDEHADLLPDQGEPEVESHRWEPESEASAAAEESVDSSDDVFGEGKLAEESSFIDASARPMAAEAGRKGKKNPSPERSIEMNEPGMSVPIDRYLRVMYEEGCSDLHMSSNNPPMYRKDGEITRLRDMDSLSPSRVEELLLPIMPDRNYEEFMEIRDTDFAYEIDGIGRFRCNVFMDRIGPGAVFRLIPDELLTAEDLDLSKDLLDLCFLNKGMVLVTGPTGSGKSTTLAALIDYINRKRKAHLITLEDPIEFVHPNKKCLVNQREIGVHTMSFQNAIRAALREDPDIVLVGEMRDLETISLAIETAETGHLVFGTLHTNTAPSTVDRIIDQFPSDRQAQIRTMLSESLKAVISQTLCKKIGGGRVAAMEILMGTRAVSNLIREAKTFQIPSMMETKKGEGMVTLNAALMELVRDKQVTPDEAYFNAVDKAALKNKLESEGYRVSVG
ncbi:MAG: type IV pilus twitching motility protein PilT [Myxococcota bacterium]